MSVHQSNDDLPRALETLTIFQVWERAARDGAIMSIGQNPTRDGLVKSPFRDDGKTGSFSICKGGRGFKDFGGAGDKGGVWKFATLCWPDTPKGDLAKLLIELSGITPTVRQPGRVLTAEDRRAMIEERKERATQAVEAVYEQREKALEPKAEAKPVNLWPEFVRQRYLAGWTGLRHDAKRQRELADERGWPVEWVAEVVEMGLISYPIERWCEHGGENVRRQKAFRVDVPQVKLVAGPSGNTASAAMIPVGYHQRWYMPEANGRPATKGWLYIPSVPKAEPKTSFEKSLLRYAAECGVTPEKISGLVPPLPFVLGDLATARVIVLLEGQWDAITFFGACGYFYDGNDPTGIAVFGIRGVQGVDVFLAYWARWLRVNKPVAWLIADNDEAGKIWREPPPAEPGLPVPPSLAERMIHAGCRDVKTSWLKAGPWGKDFNDYYRHSKPSPARMAEWMTKVGIMKNGKLL